MPPPVVLCLLVNHTHNFNTQKDRESQLFFWQSYVFISGTSLCRWRDLSRRKTKVLLPERLLLRILSWLAFIYLYSHHCLPLCIIKVYILEGRGARIGRSRRHCTERQVLAVGILTARHFSAKRVTHSVPFRTILLVDASQKLKVFFLLKCSCHRTQFLPLSSRQVSFCVWVLLLLSLHTCSSSCIFFMWLVDSVKVVFSIILLLIYFRV